ncbi:N-acetyltransferase family protein [Caproicibacter sp.]|uniref:GNAT family N-acetyltransferase n=1 Tax=Caproicibacter sp. TaxID=2814884 RepID=UPI003988EDD0
MSQIRFATGSDAEAILEIYKPYILETSITFEEEVPSPEDFRDRILSVSSAYPYLVYESEGRIRGYAYAHRYQARAAYRWNAELSVYVERSGLQKGIGKTLYGALLKLLQLQGVQNVYGIVTAPNRNSEKLHESLGFHKLGVYHNTGYKQGKWRDVQLFEKSIGGHELNPPPLRSIRELDPAAVTEILERYGHKLLEE